MQGQEGLGLFRFSGILRQAWQSWGLQRAHGDAWEDCMILETEPGWITYQTHTWITIQLASECGVLPSPFAWGTVRLRHWAPQGSFCELGPALTVIYWAHTRAFSSWNSQQIHETTLREPHRGLGAWGWRTGRLAKPKTRLESGPFPDTGHSKLPCWPEIGLFQTRILRVTPVLGWLLPGWFMNVCLSPMIYTFEQECLNWHSQGSVLR